MKPAPDVLKQELFHTWAIIFGAHALRLYGAGELRAGLPFHRQAQLCESAYRAYGGVGRISIALASSRLAL